VEFLPYIISGLVTGSVYGLAGTGLVLTYKTSGVFNFAHGALATASAFLFYTLNVNHGMPWPWAALICLVVGGLGLGGVLELLARPLARTTVAVRVAATVGILLIIQAGVIIIYGQTNELTFPHYLPQNSVTIGGSAVTVEQIIDVAIGLVATAGLYVFFRATRVGVAMRAVVDNPELLDVAGTSPTRVRRYAWMIGSTFASASGLLIAPFLTPLNATTLTLLVVTAFGAAAIGGFSSIPLTFVGGLIVGLLQAFATKYFVEGFWTGLAPALPFLVLFVILLVSPRRRLADMSLLVPRGLSTWRAPMSIQAPLGLALLVFLCLVPSFVGIRLTDWTNALTSVILLLSLGLLVRESGQVSLCHVSFLAIGACAMSQLTAQHHLPWLLALLLSGLIAVPVGAVLAIPAIRFSALYLALATFGFGLLLQYMFYGQSYMFGGFGVPLPVTRPHLSWLTLDSDRGYYYVVLACTVLAAILVLGATFSRLGRLLRGLADSPVGLAATGTAVNTTRVIVFCLSAFLAAVAGGLQTGAQPVNATSYQPLLSLTYFALIVIAVGGTPWYAVTAGLFFGLFTAYFPAPSITYWMQLLFGLGALMHALTPDSKRGAPPAVRRALDRFAWRPGGAAGRPRPVAALPAPVPRRAGSLSVEDLRVRFGGLVAVDGVTLRAETGKITGLIGPNGAGKTTTFNACSGMVRPSDGRILLSDRNVSRLAMSRRARMGLGRTFQQMQLFDTLTVRQNTALGLEGSFADSNPLSHLAASPRSARRVAAATEEALELCGLTELADVAVGDLSTGQRRLVELARCLAGPFHLLLLDEPSSGLDVRETKKFGQILQRVVRERGAGILLVEHDMSLVTSICDHIYVLDFGELIFEGAPADVIDSPVVQAAYLGAARTEAPGSSLPLPASEEDTVSKVSMS
jgi:ABC-type branched-subunit amino acid transport system ATPase component/branched-subunit amino acid ABC-type transport system permease component